MTQTETNDMTDGGVPLEGTPPVVEHLVDEVVVAPPVSQGPEAAGGRRSGYLAQTARGGVARTVWLVAGALLALPATALLVRNLGVSSYGTLALALTVIALGSAVSDLGTGSGVTRMAAFQPGEVGASWARAGIQVAALSGLGFAAAIALAGLVLGGSLGGIIVLLSPTVFLAALISVATGYLRTRQRILVPEMATSGQQVLYSGAAIALVVVGAATIWSISGAALATEVLAAVAAFFGWRAIIGRPRGGPLPRKRILRFSLPLLIAAASTLALQNSDVLLLGVFRGPRAVGLYYPVLRMVNLSALALSAVGQYFLPVATSIIAANDRQGLRDFYTTVMKWEAAILAPPLIMLIVFPQPLIVALFGAPFEAAVWATRVLAAGYLINVLTGHNWMTMVALGKTRLIGVISAVAFFGNIIVNLALIPPLGILGAALGTSLVYLALNLINGWFLWDAARILPVRRDVLVVLGVLVLGTAVPAIALAEAGINGTVVALLVVAGGVICSVTAAAITSSHDERAAFRSMFMRARGVKGVA